MNLLKEPSQSFLTEIQFNHDISGALSLLPDVRWDSKNRHQLNRPTGHWLYDPYVIANEWRNTEFERLLESIPMPIGEARLMKLSFGECYSAHADVDDRLHINLVSNDQSYLIDLNESKMYQLNTDGKLYRMNGGKIHTAVNFGSTDRIQLVIRIPLKRYTQKDFVTKTIEFLDPAFNLRYILDNHISSYINWAIKNKEIGYFNPISETKIEFHLAPDCLQKLIYKIKQVHDRIEIYD